MTVPSTTISVRTLDGLHLAATLIAPEAASEVGVVLVHGAGVTREEGGFFCRPGVIMIASRNARGPGRFCQGVRVAIARMSSRLVRCDVVAVASCAASSPAFAALSGSPANAKSY